MSATPNVPGSVTAIQQDQAQIAHDVVKNMKDSVAADVDATEKGQHAWQLHDHTVENARPLRVIVIGAGLSGIYLGLRIPEKIKNCELVIYERNPELGGTWYENTYASVACDILSHAYQYSLNPKPGRTTRVGLGLVAAGDLTDALNLETEITVCGEV